MKNSTKPHILLIVFFFFSPFFLSAQKDSLNKIDFKAQFRFKALSMVLIEDEWVTSFGIGAEWPINRKFSIVTDLVHLRWAHEREVYKSPGNYEDYDEYAQKDRKNYIALEFRRYFLFKKDPIPRFYFALCHKSGLRRIDIDDKFPLEFGDHIHLKSHFYDAGAAFGYKVGNKFIMDFCLGIAYRWETIDHSEEFGSAGQSIFTNNYRDNRPTFHIRVNFCLPFKTQNKP